jgi:cytochrome P450
VTPEELERHLAGVTVEQLDEDPYPVFAAIRAVQPVAYVPCVDLWWACTWDAVEEVASDHRRFSAKPIPSPIDRTFGEPNVLTEDGAEQRRLRRMLDPSFRPRKVEDYAGPLMEPIIAERLDALAASGPAVELMEGYFEPISVRSLALVLGLEAFEADTLRRWFYGLAEGVINYEGDPERDRIGQAMSREVDDAVVPVLRRHFDEPNESTVSQMLQGAEGSFEERVAQVLPTLKVILLGGMQEPGHGAGSVALGLLSDPAQAAAFAADPAGLARRATEEGLRWIAPIGTQTRRVVADTTVQGVAVPAGAGISAMLSSANRDDAVWGSDADSFDLFREGGPVQAAFGHGTHYCVGHHFSRLQVQMAVRALWERFPEVRLDPNRSTHVRGWEFRAPRELPVLLG